MKKYTIHFLLITVITALIGFTGLDFTGSSSVRFVCLVSFIALMVSCLDAVLLSRKKRRNVKSNRPEKVTIEN